MDGTIKETGLFVVDNNQRWHMIQKRDLAANQLTTK
jgi:hypothetical protein